MLDTSPKIPYPVAMIVFVWVMLIIMYFVSRWRQKPKAAYVIPRVFVLCSPRTVQFHYELILRVGLCSYDFNPEKHDIDLTAQGQQKNEVVPMTRLNTRTLLDEPLITTLSIIVYRLVEMPRLGSLILRHSGPFKAWLYAYDFTIIDLSTNKEQYYALNQYIGSLNRTIRLQYSSNFTPAQYPIDDVPLPKWTTEDIFLVVISVANFIMFTTSHMLINCTFADDIISVMFTAFGGGTMIFFLDWLMHYKLRWSQDRNEYFNQSASCFCPSETLVRSLIAIANVVLGGLCIYYTLPITDLKESMVWMLVNLNSMTWVFGFWSVAKQVELGETIVSLGLRLRGIETVCVGMKYSDIVSDMHAKSNSASEDGSGMNSYISRSMGVHPSVKSFGFDPSSKIIRVSSSNISGVKSHQIKSGKANKT